ncbi:MAG: tRNA lysidine(34) synthetase TilS [Planctomycetaceae bacterium]
MTSPLGTHDADAAVTSAASNDFLAALATEIPPGFWSMPVLVCCSGGADSVALLLGLVRIAPPGAAGRLVVVHAEHDLRAAAEQDRAFVVELTDRLGVRLVWGRLAVRAAGAGPRGEGVEARARRLRYDFFAAVARDVGARHAAVAHTADDQAETILQRMLRGTGLAGLGGMKEARPLCDGVALVRPLLRMRRADVRAFLAAGGEAWREDESNADVRPARNFLRHEVLPRCAAGPFPAAVESLARLGRQAEVLAGAIASAAEHLRETHSVRRADGTVVMRTASLAALDPHLVAEIFACLWRRENWPRRDMTARHYARLAAIAAEAAHSPRPTACDLPGGIRARTAGAGILELGTGADPRRPQDFMSTRRKPPTLAK